MPAVISGSLLAFAMSMDDVVISIFVNGPRLSTLPIKVYTQLKTGVTPEINALCTILLGSYTDYFYCLFTDNKEEKVNVITYKRNRVTKTEYIQRKEKMMNKLIEVKKSDQEF